MTLKKNKKVPREVAVAHRNTLYFAWLNPGCGDFTCLDTDWLNVSDIVLTGMGSGSHCSSQCLLSPSRSFPHERAHNSSGTPPKLLCRYSFLRYIVVT